MLALLASMKLLLFGKGLQDLYIRRCGIRFVNRISGGSGQFAAGPDGVRETVGAGSIIT